MATILQKIKSLALVFAIVACACSCRESGTMIDGPIVYYDYTNIVITIENKSSHEIALVDFAYDNSQNLELHSSEGVTLSYHDILKRSKYTLHIPQNEKVWYYAFLYIENINDFGKYLYPETCEVVYDSSVSVTFTQETKSKYNFLRRGAYDITLDNGYHYTFTDEDYDYAVANGVVLGDSAQ